MNKRNRSSNYRLIEFAFSRIFIGASVLSGLWDPICSTDERDKSLGLFYLDWPEAEKWPDREREDLVDIVTSVNESDSGSF